jgi:hypothetical protein
VFQAVDSKISPVERLQLRDKANEGIYHIPMNGTTWQFGRNKWKEEDGGVGQVGRVVTISGKRQDAKGELGGRNCGRILATGQLTREFNNLANGTNVVVYFCKKSNIQTTKP